MTVQKVIKRDGELVEFDINKIRLAVLSAITSCNILDDEYFDTIMDSISDQLEDIEENINLSVESIQDIVVSELKESDHPEVGIHYSDYRRTRELNRNSMLNIEHSVQRLLDKDEDVVNENANKDANVYNTQRDLTAGMVAKAKGLKDLLPTKVANAHIKGQIHWHDLDYSPYMPMTNCSVINAKGLLSDSIQIGNAIIKEPRSIGVATAKLSRIIESIASVQYGGISVGDIDLVLEPYANLNYTKHMEDVVTFNIPNGEEYARKKTIKDIYNAMQSLENEINSMSSSSGQSPFVTISIGWGTSWICKEIQKAVLNVRINKLNGKVAIFPKILFFHKKGLNFYPQDPNYDIKQLAIKCASVALYPDILNVDRLIEITGHRVSSMGCRSFPQKIMTGGDESIYSRMNVGVITLNLPRIGLESDGDVNKFWRIFRERMNIIKEGLNYRYERVKQASPKNAPLLFMQGAFGKKLNQYESVNESFKEKRATISIGYIGIYETVSSIYGLDWVKSNNKEAKEFSIEILKRMKKYADKWNENSDIHYSVYGTPKLSLGA